MQRNLEALRNETSVLSEKNTELQQNLERERSSFAADKKVLEDIIVERTNTEMHSRNDQLSRQSEIQSLEERIKVRRQLTYLLLINTNVPIVFYKAAEEKHSREVLAHAETIKAVDILKQEISTMRLTARELSTATETAQSSLKNSENSWQRQKENLEKEIADLTSRHVFFIAAGCH